MRGPSGPPSEVRESLSTDGFDGAPVLGISVWVAEGLVGCTFRNFGSRFLGCPSSTNFILVFPDSLEASPSKDLILVAQRALSFPVSYHNNKNDCPTSCQRSGSLPC